MVHDPGSIPVRERLLATACDLFYKEGIQAVGVQRVIEEAEAAKASLYAHFPSKDDLVTAYLERSATQARRRFEAHLARSSNDPKAQVLAFFDVVGEWSKTPDFRGCPFSNAHAELAEAGHPGHEAIREHRSWLRGYLQQHVVATGLPRPGQLTDALMVLLDGATATYHLDGDSGAVGSARWAAERLLNPG